MKRNVLFLVALFLLIGALPAQAADTDAKVYPGSMAVRANENEPIPQLWFSTISNPSSNYLWVDLPLIHDDVDQYCDPALHGWVKVVDRNPALDDFICKLISFYWNGNAVGCRSKSPSSSTASDAYRPGSSTYAQMFYFNEPIDAGSQDHYYYSVRMPGKTSDGQASSLVSYCLVEKEQD